MLTIENLSKSFDRPVLESFSYAFPSQGLVLIRGASGAGKTTLLRLVAGLEKPDGGSVLLEKGKRVSIVFQEDRLIPHLTLLENLLITEKKRDVPRALQILRRLGLSEEKARQYPSQLSGGMRLRGAIARSLYYGGDLYLWDEPTKELDPKNRDTVIQIMHELAKEHLVLSVTHDPSLQGDLTLEIS